MNIIQSLFFPGSSRQDTDLGIFYVGYLFVFVEYLCNRSPKWEQKNSKIISKSVFEKLKIGKPPVTLANQNIQLSCKVDSKQKIFFWSDLSQKNEKRSKKSPLHPSFKIELSDLPTYHVFGKFKNIKNFRSKI